MDFSEKWGKDADEAVKLALAELKLTIDDVNVIVLEESSKGFFGFGSKLAKVRVEKKAPKQEQKKPKEPESRKNKEPENKERKPEPKKEHKEHIAKPFGENQKENHRETKKDHSAKPERKSDKRNKTSEQGEYIEEERPKDLVLVEDHPVLDFIKEVSEKMGLSLNIQAMKNESSIYVDIEGKDSGTIIGKRGQTLDAIQYLASLVANKEKDNYVKVIVDAEGYRSKREKALEQLADRLAGKVVRTKKSVRLEPMNPYERKVIHARLQSNGKVTTRSEGEEPYRRVIIELK